MDKRLFNPTKVLPEFDEFLASKGIRFEAIVIGAGALSMMGIISRQTHDFDVLDPVIPREIKSLAEEFRKKINGQGTALDENWLNNGPISIGKILPKGWQSRVQPLFSGKAIALTTLGKIDFLRTKIDALCQRGTDFKDIVHMNPTRDELLEAAEWVKQQDANPDYPDWVQKQIARVAKELGFEL